MCMCICISICVRICVLNVKVYGNLCANLGVCLNLTQVCDGVNGWIEPNYTLIEDYEMQESLCDGLDNDCDGAGFLRFTKNFE